MEFIGTAGCENEQEAASVLERLKAFEGVNVDRSELDITAEFSSKDTIPTKEEEAVVDGITHIIESVMTHGLFTFRR